MRARLAGPGLVATVGNQFAGLVVFGGHVFLQHLVVGDDCMGKTHGHRFGQLQEPAGEVGPLGALPFIAVDVHHNRLAGQQAHEWQGDAAGNPQNQHQVMLAVGVQHAQHIVGNALHAIGLEVQVDQAGTFEKLRALGVMRCAAIHGEFAVTRQVAHQLFGQGFPTTVLSG
ncbi:hypothetical protein D9M71_598170 [compost metagenome]